jgi:hypothetical protein
VKARLYHHRKTKSVVSAVGVTKCSCPSPAPAVLALAPDDVAAVSTTGSTNAPSVMRLSAVCANGRRIGAWSMRAPAPRAAHAGTAPCEDAAASAPVPDFGSISRLIGIHQLRTG